MSTIKKEIIPGIDWWVVGIIDVYGVVHSRRIGDLCNATHDNLFPMQTFKRWRWTYSGITYTWGPSDFEDGDLEKIERHLTKKYRIKWDECGNSNVDHLIENGE